MNRHFSKVWLWPAALAATIGCVDTAKAYEVATIHPEEKVCSMLTTVSSQFAACSAILRHIHTSNPTLVDTAQSWQLLPLSTRQRTFFKYEKRIRDLSGPDKIFEYFATETKEDGARCVCP